MKELLLYPIRKIKYGWGSIAIMYKISELLDSPLPLAYFHNVL